jgi:hypothetical protein
MWENIIISTTKKTGVTKIEFIPKSNIPPDRKSHGLSPRIYIRPQGSIGAENNGSKVRQSREL